MTKNYCDLCGIHVNPREVYDPESGRPEGGWKIPVLDTCDLNPNTTKKWVTYERVMDCCIDCAKVIQFTLACLEEGGRRREKNESHD